MKATYSILFIIYSYILCAQLEKVDWTPATITMHDGKSVTSDITLDNRFFEGTIVVNDNGKYLSLSPQKVGEFVVFVDEDSVKFRSVQTRFLKWPGQKKSFLKEDYIGDRYSLFSKHIPDKKTSGFLVPVGGSWILYGVFQYLKDEEIFFLEKDGIAYQITTPYKDYEYEGVIKTDKKLFEKILGDDFRFVQQQIKSKKLKLRLKDDLITILEIANSL